MAGAEGESILISCVQPVLLARRILLQWTNKDKKPKLVTHCIKGAMELGFLTILTATFLLCRVKSVSHRALCSLTLCSLTAALEVAK